MTHARRTRSLLRGTVLGAVLLVSACSSTRSYHARPGPYDLLPAGERVPLRGARQALEAGDLTRAEAYLRPVEARHTRNLGVRAFLQDLELALLSAGMRLPDVEPLADPKDAPEALRQHYLDVAQERDTAADWVLAARIEDDGGRALQDLERAETLDPTCVWVDYGRAWWFFRLRRFPEARESVTAAYQKDPGHLPTMRLESQMLAGANDYPAAIHVLSLWLERTAEDPLFATSERAEATVDLAILRLQEGDARAALALLDEVAPGPDGASPLRDPARSELVRAAAYDARGELDLAIEASSRAASLSKSDLLPLVQEAWLVVRRGEGADAERRAWQRVLDAAHAARGEGGEGSVDLAGVLYELIARTRLERIEDAEPALRSGKAP